MRKSIQFIVLVSLISFGISNVVGEQTAPAPDQDKIIEELDEHWTEEIYPDIIEDVSEKFESFDLGIPVK